jgi:CO dehydrogenase maturation factor
MSRELQAQRNLSGKRIGVFGKGGAGKSTLTVLLARTLQRKGYQVVLLDADSTNLGLYMALGIDHTPVPLMDYFGGMVFQGGKVTCPVDDPMPLEDSEINLDELPDKYYVVNSVGITLLTLGKIGDKGPGSGCDGPVSKIARDVRIYDNDRDLITLIDFKAGFEDSARGVITGLDWAIAVIDPTIAAIEMALSLNEMVKQIKNNVLPSTSHLESPELVMWANRVFQNASIERVFFIINRVPNERIESQLLEKLVKKGIKPIGILHEYPEIALSWLEGSEVGKEDIFFEMDQIVNELEKADSLKGVS